MNSSQEEIVRLFMERSAGAPFVFEPDEYRKGPGKREPADLAWVCNGCVVLFNMTTTTRDCDWAINHNLEKLGGFLRAWRGGQPLTGHNLDRVFSIAHNEYPHTVLVSVVDCPDPVLRYHHAEATKLRVARCATLSQTALHMLANMPCTMFDILRLIDSLRTTRDEVRGLEIIELVTQFEADAMSTAAAHLIPNERDCIRDIQEAERLIHNMRLPAPNALSEGTAGERWRAAEIFNDMRFMEYLQLIFSCASMVHSLRTWRAQNKRVAITRRMSIEDMDIVIRGITTPEIIKESNAMDPPIWREIEVGAGRVDVIIVATPLDIFLTPVVVTPRSGQSRTQALLRA